MKPSKHLGKGYPEQNFWLCSSAPNSMINYQRQLVFLYVFQSLSDNSHTLKGFGCWANQLYKKIVGFITSMVINNIKRYKLYLTSDKIVRNVHLQDHSPEHHDLMFHHFSKWQWKKQKGQRLKNGMHPVAATEIENAVLIFEEFGKHVKRLYI